MAQIVYGRVSTVSFVLLVKNVGDDTFLTTLELTFHSDLAIDRVSVDSVRIIHSRIFLLQSLFQPDIIPIKKKKTYSYRPSVALLC